jgi:hypothetical protein
MTIDKDCGQDDQMNPGSQAEAHSLIALEQSALYAARLAIARWINSSADPAMLAAVPDPAWSPRANWYAQAQQNFQEWLGRGGFAQYDSACAAEAPAAGAQGSDVRPLAGAAAHPAWTCIN